MKKLFNKVFWVLFSILSIFLISILFIFNYTNYSDVKNRIRNSLNIMDRPNRNNMDETEPPGDKKNIRFMDISVYSVILSGDEVLEVINHDINLKSESDIKMIAREVLDNKKSDYYIGNLYFDKYSYSLSGNVLTICENGSVNKGIINNLIISIFVFVVSEIIIVFVSLKITEWISRPVIDAFKKQKEFIADASHELKTPLAVIMASSEALEKTMDNKYVKNIVSESERMNKLILSLLDLAKSENKNKEYKEVDLSKLVEKSILTFESIIYENNIKLDYNIDQNVKLICDSDEIKQVMSILIDNAIKHSEENGEIFVEMHSAKNEVNINVRNKGKAISKEDEDKIFERFYKADKSRNRNSNTYGLGLAIAKNIVTNHGGIISAHS